MVLNYDCSKEAISNALSLFSLPYYKTVLTSPQEYYPQEHDGVYHFSHPTYMFVCVEVLRPSQPSGVMSSAVSLPNHTFTGQA